MPQAFTAWRMTLTAVLRPFNLVDRLLGVSEGAAHTLLFLGSGDPVWSRKVWVSASSYTPVSLLREKPLLHARFGHA